MLQANFRFFRIKLHQPRRLSRAGEARDGPAVPDLRQAAVARQLSPDLLPLGRRTAASASASTCRAPGEQLRLTVAARRERLELGYSMGLQAICGANSPTSRCTCAAFAAVLGGLVAVLSLNTGV